MGIRNIITSVLKENSSVYKWDAHAISSATLPSLVTKHLLNLAVLMKEILQ